MGQGNYAIRRNSDHISPDMECCIPLEPPWNAGFSRDIDTFGEICKNFQDCKDVPEFLDTFYDAAWQHYPTFDFSDSVIWDNETPSALSFDSNFQKCP